MSMARALPIYWIMFISALGYFCACSKSFSGKFVVGTLLLFLLLSYVSTIGPACISWSTPRLENLEHYSPSFVRKIRGLGGNLVLFEAQGGWNYATETKLRRQSEKWSDDIHFVGVVALETGKNLFSTTIDGFHPSTFRSNAVSIGTYKGRFLSEYAPQEIDALLRKWGIKYLVVWSNEARNYFGRQGSLYKRIWNIDTGELQRAGFEPVRWEVCEFLDADPRSVVVAPGSGEIETKDYFTKTLRLQGVKTGERVIVRMYYFPSWKASWEGHAVGLFNEEGQLALRSPADGNMIIRLYFPKNTLLTILAVSSLAVCFFLAKRGIV